MSDCVLAVEKALIGVESLVVALSGGMDSVALLHICREIAKKRPLALYAAHMEHGIRGEESLRDMAFCQRLCADWGLPLLVKREDVPALARGANLEETARELRYRFLEEARQHFGAAFIATAHHADDQLETILLHLIRGSALRGLCGMEQQRGSLIRPLLYVGKESIEAYVRQHHLPYCTDSTNADKAYARNDLRLSVLPCLKALNPRVAETVAENAISWRRDEDVLTAEAKKLYAESLTIEGLRLPSDAPFPLRMRILRLYLEALQEKDIDQGKLNALDQLAHQPSGKRASIGNRLFETWQGYLFPVEEGKSQVVTVMGEGEWRFGENRLCITKQDRPESPVSDANTVWFDAEGFSFPLTLRTRRRGDRFRPFGLGGEKNLADWLSDRKIPKGRRDALAVLMMGETLLWLPGLQRSAALPVTEKTTSVYRLQWSKDRTTISDKEEHPA